MRKCGAASGFIIVCLLLWNPPDRLLYSVRLASALQDIASGEDPEHYDVEETGITGHKGNREYCALSYRSRNSIPTKALVLVPGISELGCHHPMLIAIARFLADQGFLVITPDIREFRKFRISAEPVEQILFWFQEAENSDESRKAVATGIAGISYSGTLALIAAGRPEIRDKVAFALSVGGYHDLLRCANKWFSTEPDIVNEGYPTRFYARWVMMLSALDMVPTAESRNFLKNMLRNLLLQKEISHDTDGLTPEEIRWRDLATGEENESESELARRIEKHLKLRLYRQLDPGPALRELRCPVFLIHGAYDDLIPPEESLELHRRIAGSRLLISPFLSHTHPSNTDLTWRQKAAAALHVLLFCYRFSRVIH